MPKVIKIKRGDVNSLNNHILADGELAFTRHRVMEAGPQRGETVEDNYFRVGDGTQAGGIVPGAASIGVGLLFAIATASSATRQIEALVGEYWTPWKWKTFVAPYNPFRTVDTTRDCLTPDIYNSIINVHLGNGFLMFDGTAFEMRLTGQRYLFEADWERDSASYGGNNSSIFFGYYNNTVDWTGGDGHRRCSGNLMTTGNAATSTVSKQHMIGQTAQVANYSDVTCDAGICYVASPVNPGLNDLAQPTCKVFNTMIGYQVDTWNNIRWFDGTPAHTTPPIGEFYGFKVLDQTARMFSNLVHAFHVGSIDTTNYCKGLYMEQIGGSSSLADGIYINRVGTNAARDAGATYADGITIRSVGWYNIGANSGCTLAGGLFIDDIRGKDGACGIRIASVTSSSGVNTDLAIGIKVGNLKRLVASDGWGYGFYFAPTELLQLSGCVPFAIEGYDFTAGGVGSKFAYGYDAYLIGQTNAINVYAFSGYKLGNLVSTTDSWGLFLGDIKSCVHSRGINISGVYSDSDQTSLLPFAKGLDITNISGTRDSAAYGIFAENITSIKKTAAGIYLGDICATDVNSPSNIFGIYKQGQTTRYFKSFMVLGAGALDCTTVVVEGSHIFGIYFNSLGKSCYEAVGVFFDAIGCDNTGAGTSGVDRGIHINRIGNDTSAVVAQGILLGDIRGKGDSCGISIGSVKTTGTFNDSTSYLGNMATGVRVGNLHAHGTTGWGCGFLVSPTEALQVGGAIGYGINNFDVAAGSNPGWIYAIDIYNVGLTNAKNARGIAINNLGHITNTTTSKGIHLGTINASGYAAGGYISNVHSSSATLVSSAFAEGLHITDITGSQQSGAYGVVAENIISNTRASVGYYVGDLAAGASTGNLTVNNYVSAFYKAAQNDRNFRIMSVIYVDSQDVVTGGDTSAAIYGLAFNSLGDRYAKSVYGISLGPIATHTSSNASEAYGIHFGGQIGNNNCTTTRGIHIGPTRGVDVYALKIDSVLGGTSTGIFISSITGASISGITIGAIDCTSGTAATGIYLSSVVGWTSSRGLDIGLVGTHSTGSTSEGIFLNNVTSTNGSKGIYIGNASTSAASSTSYGLYALTITANAAGSVSRGIYMETINAPSGAAIGIDFQSVWGLTATGVRLGGVNSTGAGDAIGFNVAFVYNTSTGNARGIHITDITSLASSSVVFGYNVDNIYSGGYSVCGFRASTINAPAGISFGIGFDSIQSSGIARGLYVGILSSTLGSAYGIDLNNISCGNNTPGYGAVGCRIDNILSPGSLTAANAIQITDVTSANGTARGIYMANIETINASPYSVGLQIETVRNTNGNSSCFGASINTVNARFGSSYGLKISSVHSGLTDVAETTGDVYGLYINDTSGCGSGWAYGIRVEGVSRSGSTSGIPRGILINNVRNTTTGDSRGLEISNIYAGTGVTTALFVNAESCTGYPVWSLWLEKSTGENNVRIPRLPVRTPFSGWSDLEVGQFFVATGTTEVHVRTV